MHKQQITEDKPCLCRSSCGANFGQPVAIFISEMGFWIRNSLRVCPAYVNNVLASVLVQQLEGHLVLKRLFKDLIKIALHYHYEDGEMSPLTSSVSKGVQPKAHFVTITMCVERETVDWCTFARLYVILPLSEVGSPPNFVSPWNHYWFILNCIEVV